MRQFLFLMVGVEPFTLFADNRKAAIACGLETLGYVEGMPTPRHTAVPVA